MRTKTFRIDSVESKAIAETRFNSRKLFEDAQTMFLSERWATCIALSILACEEAAKFFILRYRLGTSFHGVSELRHHKAKHAKFSLYFRRCLYRHALDRYFERAGEKDPIKRLFTALEFHDKCFEIALIGGDGAIDADPEVGPIWAEIRNDAAKDEAYRIAEESARGNLDKIKQRALYVDVTEKDVLSPRQFTRDDASPYLRAAELVSDEITIKGAPKDKPQFLHHVQSKVKLRVEPREVRLVDDRADRQHSRRETPKL